MGFNRGVKLTILLCKGLLGRGKGLLILASVEYCLGVGLNFEVAAATVKRLKDEGLVLTSVSKGRERFMLGWDRLKGKLELVEFDLEKAIALLEQGKPMIPVWLDEIYQQLAKKLS
jgi:hypothetical protein